MSKSYLRSFKGDLHSSSDISTRTTNAPNVKRVRICYTLHDRNKNGGFPLSVLLPKRLPIPPPLNKYITSRDLHTY